MVKAKEKNTRLLYTDEKHIKMYEALPPQQFKDLIMAMLKYEYGDEQFVDTIQDPMVKTLFIGEKVDIDRNEEKYEEIKRKRQEAGSKGGRPRKQEELPDDLQEVIELKGQMYRKEDLYNGVAENLYSIQKSKGDRAMYDELDAACRQFDLNRKELLIRKNNYGKSGRIYND